MIAISESGLGSLLSSPVRMSTMRISEGQHYKRNHWHKTFTQAVFTDGHIELLKDDFIYGGSDPALRHWNNDNEPHQEIWAMPGNR